MTKISYDSSYFERMINPSVESAISSINDARSYLNSISIPSDFSKKNNLNEVISDLYDEKNKLCSFITWTSNTKMKYTRVIEEYEKNLNSIDTKTVKKRDGLD